MASTIQSATKSNTSSDGNQTATRVASFVDSETILRISNLELRARVIVEGFMSGLHRSPYHGFSVEFSDYRQYSPGDDLRHLDWKLLARQDRLYIKRFEDETNLRCFLLVDLSRSMSFGSTVGFGSTGFSKAEYARTTAATLAYFLSLQRDAVGIVTFDETISDYLPPRFRPGHLRRLMLCLERSTAGTSTSLSRPLEHVAETLTKRGLVILISDLLAPTEELTRQLGFLRSKGHDVILMRILDPAELNFAFESAAIFQDLETGKEIYVDPATVAADYKKRFGEHASIIKQCCDELGIDLFQITTSEPLEKSLFNLMQARAQPGRRFSRGKMTGGRA
jgi:uncharacterized protein (DUF58 family)